MLFLALTFSWAPLAQASCRADADRTPGVVELVPGGTPPEVSASALPAPREGGPEIDPLGHR